MGKGSRITTPGELTRGNKIILPGNPFNIENYDNLKPAFSFEYVQGNYCLSKWNNKKIKRLIEELAKFETHTWAEIQRSSIFRYSKVNKNGLTVSIPAFITPDVNIYYLKPFGSNTPYRVFGVREGHNFKFLWFDYKHEVYPGCY
jgi:hypothetical protein